VVALSLSARSSCSVFERKTGRLPSRLGNVFTLVATAVNTRAGLEMSICWRPGRLSKSLRIEGGEM
jgi:hypothetical protein